MNPNDDQLNFNNRHLDLLSKHRSVFKDKHVLDYYGLNGFQADIFRSWGANPVSTRILDKNMRKFAHEYFPNITVIDQISQNYDVIVICGNSNFELEYNGQAIIEELTNCNPEYILLHANAGIESPQPKSAWEISKSLVKHRPNISWYIAMFQRFGFECDYIEKYLLQYTDYECSFFRFYNTKTVTSTPITIDQAWQLNFPESPRQTDFTWDKFNQVIG